MSARPTGIALAAAAVIGHVVTNLAHGAAHAALGLEPPPGSMPFLVIVVLAAPIAGLVLALASRPIPGAIVIGTSLLASLAFGIAWHFVIDSPDRCDHVGAGAWSTTFRITAAMLAITEVAGVVASVVVLRSSIATIGADATRAVILVDGTCVFCTHLVRWLLAHDRAGRFEFAHTQGALGTSVLARAGIDPPDLDGVYLVLDPGTDRERLLVDGAAGRVIYPRVVGLAGAWPHLVPMPLLNAFYRSFARVRYRLFGQSEQCIVPTPAERARFVEA